DGAHVRGAKADVELLGEPVPELIAREHWERRAGVVAVRAVDADAFRGDRVRDLARRRGARRAVRVRVRASAERGRGAGEGDAGNRESTSFVQEKGIVHGFVDVLAGRPIQAPRLIELARSKMTIVGSPLCVAPRGPKCLWAYVRDVYFSASHERKVHRVLD